MPPKTFAMNLKAIRTTRGLTQVELAKRLKVKQPFVAALENGTKANPSLDVLRRLAKALPCKVSELIE
jgi:transcriptional regulator with XRE-family HTH domain